MILNDKRWRNPQEIMQYIEKLEHTIDVLETRLRNNCERNKNKIILEFFENCRYVLSPVEIILISLKLSGYSYRKIELISKSSSLSLSSVRRHVLKASIKLAEYYQNGSRN